jgi:hypothetical protein
MYDVKEVKSPLAGTRAMKVGDCYVMVGNENGMWHLSISNPDHYPDWDTIKWSRYNLCPKDITMVMVLPPETEYVDIHDKCFHLWQIKDENKKSRIHLIQ